MIGVRRRRRARLILFGGLAFFAAIALFIYAFGANFVYFVSPTELLERVESGEAEADERFRIGGLVEPGSLTRGGDAEIVFRVTDNANVLIVRFRGVPPDLFAEGQGVVAEGVYRDGEFIADKILAKHDEEYMPRSVAEKLQEQGRWRADGQEGGQEGEQEGGDAGY